MLAKCRYLHLPSPTSEEIHSMGSAVRMRTDRGDKSREGGGSDERDYSRDRGSSFISPVCETHNAIRTAKRWSNDVNDN